MGILIEEFAYVVKTDKNFEDAVISVLKAVDQKDWSLFQVYDVKERLAAKGFRQQNLKIIEICSGKHANQFLTKNRLISLCMPCKINVLEDNKKVLIAGMKPIVISHFFPEIDKAEAEDVEKEIIEIINKAR